MAGCAKREEAMVNFDKNFFKKESDVEVLLTGIQNIQTKCAYRDAARLQNIETRCMEGCLPTSTWKPCSATLRNTPQFHTIYWNSILCKGS